MAIKNLEEGNIENIKEVCRSIIPLHFLRYMGIVEFYTEEPAIIKVKKTEKSQFEEYKQVFRLRQWMPNKGVNSWMIYSKHRELYEIKNSEVLIRNVIWNQEKDIIKYRETKNKEKMRNDFPDMQFNNIYICKRDTKKLVEEINHIDDLISNGIILERRNENEKFQYWQEMEIKRLYDWGSVNSIWSTYMTNKKIEEQCEILMNKLPEYVNSKDGKIYEIELDYIYPPHEYRKIIYGE